MKLPVFVGSGDASRIERGVLEYSLLRHSTQPYDLHVYNGSEGSVENGADSVWKPEVLAALRGRRFATEFSLFRYVIPELCNFHGRALYLDSDMICLGDIAELASLPLPDGAWFASVPGAYPEIGPERWALSVMVIDCARCRFDLQSIFAGIERGEYTYTEFSQMAPRFLARHPVPIAPLSPSWNSFDTYNSETRLIHYTDLDRQPWKFKYHPAGGLWHRYLMEALQHGTLTEDLLRRAIDNRSVRPDIKLGPNGPNGWRERLGAPLHDMRLQFRDAVRWLAYRSGWAR